MLAQVIEEVDTRTGSCGQEIFRKTPVGEGGQGAGESWEGWQTVMYV